MGKRKSPNTRPHPMSRHQALLLRTMELRRWMKRLEGCLGFLMRLQNMHPDKTDRWVHGNREYYLTQVKSLLNNAPGGTEDIVLEARAVISVF